MSDFEGVGCEDFLQERRAAEARAREAEAKAVHKEFSRLRVNVRYVTPAHVSFGVFQSGNGGVNWACAGDLTVDRDWFEAVFGAGVCKEHARFEFEIGATLVVEPSA